MRGALRAAFEITLVRLIQSYIGQSCDESLCVYLFIYSFFVKRKLQDSNISPSILVFCKFALQDLYDVY